jgi:predicted membrane protein
VESLLSEKAAGLMREKILRALMALVSIVVAAWLFMDASTFAMVKANPETGRLRGCYTTLELIFGVKQPVEWVRPVQFVISSVLGIYGLALIVCWPKDR